MKFLRILLCLPIICLMIFYTSTSISSCNKTTTIRDTVVTIIRDTTIKIIRDTTIQVDTVYDLTDGLVAYYNFNGGNLNDSSGNGNKITFSNATAAADRFGRAGNAFSFDGLSNYMMVPNSPSLSPINAITLMSIVKVNGFYQGPCAANQILGKTNISDNENGFYCLRFTDFANNCAATPPNPATEQFNAAYGPTINGIGAFGPNVKLGQWYTLIFTFDGFQSKFYVNGALVSTTTGSITSFTPNTDPLFIGKCAQASYPYYFNGVIDEIRIYNRSLTDKEAAQLNKVTE
jgi:hypothetical protein